MIMSTKSTIGREAVESDTFSKLRGKKVLVLGASGFIGTNLSIKLHKIGSIVTRFGRENKFNSDLKDTTWIKGNFSEAASVARAVEGQNIIFHCISESVPGSSNINTSADLLSNVRNTLSLLDMCKEAGTEEIIFMSSGGTVYGQTGSTPVSELYQTNPISAYGVSKLAIEKYLGLYNYLHNLDYKIIRISNPYGPYQIAHRQQGIVSAIVEKALKRKTLEIWGDGTVVRDYIFIEDLVQAILKISCYAGNERTFNVGSGIPRTINDIIYSLEDILKQKIERTYLAARKSDVKYNLLDISRVKNEVGWVPSSDWKESLEKTVNWMKFNLIADN